MEANSSPTGITTTTATALRDMIAGSWVSQCLYVAAKLGVADVLEDGPLALDALAEAVGADADPLRRVLRALASLGVFAEDDQGRFGLTELADNLRSGAPTSLRDFAVFATKAGIGERGVSCCIAFAPAN
ncbi:MAG: methyltransferase dimerization domain-containing protein, partial [Chloroflexota bacterium]